MTKSAFLRASVVTAAIALSAFTSCITTDKTLGSKYVPDNQDMDILTDEIDLPVELRMADSLQSSISGTIILGSINTDTFGTIKLTAATSITAATDSIYWGGDPILKSITLECPVTGHQYLEEDQIFITQNLRAYQLKEKLDSTKIYSNSITRKDCQDKCITKGNAIYMGGDTLYMHLTEEFGQQFFNYDIKTLDSADLFMDSIKGIYFEMDDLEEGVNGGRLNFIDLSASYIDIHFSSIGYEGERRDTVVSFLIGNYTAVTGITSGSAKHVTSNPEEKIYIEGFNGIKPFISAVNLKRSIGKWASSKGLDLTKVIVVKAALEFPFDYSGNYKDYSPFPTNLFPCQRVEATTGDIVYSPIDEIYDDNMSDGSINKSLDYYKPDAGNFIQDLIRTDESKLTYKDDIWMMQTYAYTNSTSSTTYYYTDYNNYYIGIINGTKCDRRPKLHLTYAILK